MLAAYRMQGEAVIEPQHLIEENMKITALEQQLLSGSKTLGTKAIAELEYIINQYSPEKILYSIVSQNKNLEVNAYTISDKLLELGIIEKKDNKYFITLTTYNIYYGLIKEYNNNNKLKTETAKCLLKYKIFTKDKNKEEQIFFENLGFLKRIEYLDNTYFILSPKGQSYLRTTRKLSILGCSPFIYGLFEK